MKLTDLMLQKLQIALHMKLFKYVSQVLSKNQINFECEFSQLPLFYRYTTNADCPRPLRVLFFPEQTWRIICIRSSWKEKVPDPCFVCKHMDTRPGTILPDACPYVCTLVSFINHMQIVADGFFEKAKDFGIRSAGIRS